MKKLFLFVAIVFAALALSSCSKDGASVSITNKNLVGTWELVQTTTDEGKTIDIHPSLNRNDKIWMEDYYEEFEKEEGSVYEELEYYEELVFTEYSVTTYSWHQIWDEDEDEDKDGWAYEWSTGLIGELEYHIRDKDIWMIGIKTATIKKLTTKELLLYYCNGGETRLYRKK